MLSGADEALAAVYPPRQVGDSRLRDSLTDAIRRHDERLCRALDSVPQTNEVARSAMLLPGFLAIARETRLPLEIAEIGASAGLNLNFDRCHYRYGAEEWGDPASPVRLKPELRGKVPPLDGALKVSERSGCDIAPVDLSNKAARLRLRCFIWADQTSRLERLDAAIGLALAAPVTWSKPTRPISCGKSSPRDQKGRSSWCFIRPCRTTSPTQRGMQLRRPSAKLALSPRNDRR